VADPRSVRTLLGALPFRVCFVKEWAILRFGFPAASISRLLFPGARSQFTNSRLFNALTSRSNDMYKVIDKWCTFVLFSRVFANQNPRRSTSLAFVASCPLHFRHHDEKSHTATPLVPADCKCPLPQPLSLHILTNAPGVWGSIRPFLKFYLNSFALNALFRARSRFANPLFSSRCALFQVPYLVSPLLGTLTKTAGCVPTLPILEHFHQSRCKGPPLSALPLRAQHLCVILFRSSLLNFQL